MTQVHPLIFEPAMWDHLNYVGTCDWGSCDRDTTALRWDSNRQRYLSVCIQHQRGRGPTPLLNL